MNFIALYLWLRLIFRGCRHDHIRCIHGDEINNTVRGWLKPSIARTRCLDCGRALYKVPMPERCYNTGTLHTAWDEHG